MIFNLKITKIDILSIVLLSILFFSIAAYNVGAFNYAVTNWENTASQSFYVDLGSTQYVDTVFFFVRQGNATVQVSSGSPGNWSHLGQFVLSEDDGGRDFHKFYDFTVDSDTRYIEFNVSAVKYDSRPQFWWVVNNPSNKEPSPYIAVSEIGLINQDYQQISIVGVTGENNTDASIAKLVDEQGVLELPPTYMSKMYFDEIYWARGAIDLAVNHQIPNEQTHPPLGKLVQSTGVAVFGETPFGWRIMGVLFGTLMVPLMYLIGKKLFGTWIGAFTAAFLFSFDFLHFAMARIGTVDTYMVFFSMLSQFFFLIYFAKALKNGWKNASVIPLILAVIAFSCAFASKFGFPLFGALGLLSLLVLLRLRDVKNLKGSLSDKYVAFFDHPFLLLIACIGIVAAIYFASYIPEMLLGSSPGAILNLQNAMFSFHAGSVVDASASPWWSWPLTLKSRWFDISRGLPNDTVSTISAFGNPAVFWVGFAAMIILAVEAFHIPTLISNLSKKSSLKQIFNIRDKGWDAAAIFIVVVFGFAWLPYVFVGRAAYIYHYYSAVPMLCLALAYFVNRYWHKPIGKVAAISLFVAVVALFFWFYPVISGSPTTVDHIKELIWLNGWGFLG